MAEQQETIALAGNVMVPAILTLEAAGYVVRRVESDGREAWRAERRDRTLIADDPAQLLGLASVRDSRGPDWRATDDEIQSTLDRFYLK